jgi:hypothetical protein
MHEPGRAPAAGLAGDQLRVDLVAGGAGHQLALLITMVLATGAIARGAPAAPARLAKSSRNTPSRESHIVNCIFGAEEPIPPSMKTGQFSPHFGV